jgi:hypothetical protein
MWLTWKSAWFRLRSDGVLLRYADEVSTPHSRSWDLSNTRTVAEIKSGGSVIGFGGPRKFKVAIELGDRAGTILVLAAATEGERRRWIGALTEVVAVLRRPAEPQRHIQSGGGSVAAPARGAKSRDVQIALQSTLRDGVAIESLVVGTPPRAADRNHL